MRAEPTMAEVRRRLGAAPERVFAAFCDPELVCRWLKPSPEIGLIVLGFDFRVGGGYRFRYAAPGGPAMHVNGTFLAIEPPSRLVFSWNIEPPDEHAGLESEVTVSITRDGDTGSMLVIRHEQLTQAGAAARHAEGWRGALDLLAGLTGIAEAANDR
jgi:uncharacterized protein YndB with AHSA1/START domain